MLTESHFHAPGGPAMPTCRPSCLRLRCSPARFIPGTVRTGGWRLRRSAWSGDVSQGPGPLMVLFHGLEGSIHSHYAKGLFAHLQRQGNEAVLMHFRGAAASRTGCCGPTTRRHRGCRGGDRRAGSALPGKPLVAIGYSLGATCWSICWRGPVRMN